MRPLLLLLLVSASAGAAGLATTKQQQSTIARWTGEKICEMGVDAFYALPDPELKTMFERDTSMSYQDVPAAPNERSEPRSGELTGYLGSLSSPA